MNNSIKKYYLTFGSSGQIYEGGWVEVYAETLRAAQIKFAQKYKERAFDDNGFLNYAFPYFEEEFAATKMAKEGNYGAFCHEVIK